MIQFGLINEPTTFHYAMTQVFWKHLRKYILVFFNDILIYNKMWEEHLIHLENVLKIL